jgi:hypothetical protein
VSLNLNDDFEGGELVFPGICRRPHEPAAGRRSGVFCSLLHVALPVTRGRRFVLTTFLSSQAMTARYAGFWGGGADLGGPLFRSRRLRGAEALPHRNPAGWDRQMAMGSGQLLQRASPSFHGVG